MRPPSLSAFCCIAVMWVASPAGSAPVAPVETPMSSVRHDAVFKVPGGAPDWMVVTGDSVWVSDYPAGAIHRLDPRTNTIAATIPIGKAPCSGIAAGFGSIWVPVCSTHSLARVDINTNKVAGHLPYGPADSEGGIATGAGSIWMLTDKAGTLSRINPATGSVAARIKVPSGSFSCAYGDGAVWVTSTEHNQLVRVDPATNSVTGVAATGSKPRFLTIGGGSVWTLNQGDGTITRVSSANVAVLATIDAKLAGTGGEIAWGEGAVWATLFKVPVSRIDPAANRVSHRWTGPGGDSIRLGFGSVWLTDLKGHEIWRIAAPQLQR